MRLIHEIGSDYAVGVDMGLFEPGCKYGNLTREELERKIERFFDFHDFQNARLVGIARAVLDRNRGSGSVEMSRTEFDEFLALAIRVQHGFGLSAALKKRMLVDAKAR